ncbi:MAG: DUF697 domain-containing protein [Saprospiraceae bacterium]
MRKKITDLAKSQLKKSFMPDGKNDKDRHAETVIRNHVLWSMGASYIIPLPIADVFAVSALQLDMIRQLCRVYDVDFAETQGKAIVSALTTSTMARAGARSLIKLVPMIGTVVGGITTSVINGASTYALGEVFRKHFSSGGTILDFDVERLKKVYRDKFEKGKTVAKEWKETEAAPADAPAPAPAPGPTLVHEPIPPTEPMAKTASSFATDEVMAQLKELGQLRQQGILSEAEFNEMKEKLIRGFGK